MLVRRGLLAGSVFSLVALVLLFSNHDLCEISSSAYAQPPANPWSIEFIPVEADAVSVIINGKVWNPSKSECAHTWTKKDGKVTWALPVEFAKLDEVHVLAVSHPWGTNGKLIVRHNGNARRTYTFSKSDEARVGAGK